MRKIQACSQSAVFLGASADTRSAAGAAPATLDVRIDILRETLIRLADVRDHLPRNAKGKKADRSVAFRWAGKGLKNQRLEYIQIGGVRHTSLEALQRFFDRLTHGAPGPAFPASPKREAEITKAEQDVKSALARRGAIAASPQASPTALQRDNTVNKSTKATQ
jgi:hypothetical protein